MCHLKKELKSSASPNQPAKAQLQSYQTSVCVCVCVCARVFACVCARQMNARMCVWLNLNMAPF